MAGAILVVDDSATMRMIVQATLQEAGWSVQVARDGQDALNQMHAGEFSLVVTDWNMPNMDGAALVAAMRANIRFSAVPVLILTTEDDEDVVQRGQSLGVSGWIAKPLEPSVLLQAVQCLLGQTA